MNKKGGFTIVELLAVIVLLSAVALIAVPQVIKIINTSKENAFRENVRSLIKEIDSYRVNNPYVTLGSISDLGLDSNLEGVWQYNYQSKEIELTVADNNYHLKTTDNEIDKVEIMKEATALKIIDNESDSLILDDMIGFPILNYKIYGEGLGNIEIKIRGINLWGHEEECFADTENSNLTFNDSGSFPRISVSKTMPYTLTADITRMSNDVVTGPRFTIVLGYTDGTTSSTMSNYNNIPADGVTRKYIAATNPVEGKTVDHIRGWLFDYGSRTFRNNKAINIMLLEGSYDYETIPAYQPYYEPITKFIDLESGLENGEYLDFKRQAVITADGSIKERIHLPVIETFKGTTIIEIAGASKLEIKYKYKK